MKKKLNRLGRYRRGTIQIVYIKDGTPTSIYLPPDSYDRLLKLEEAFDKQNYRYFVFIKKIIGWQRKHTINDLKARC